MFHTGLLKGWERRLEIGLDGSAGSSQNETFRSTINLKYADDKSRWHSRNAILSVQRMTTKPQIIKHIPI